jgi:hypothetical protein
VVPLPATAGTIAALLVPSAEAIASIAAGERDTTIVEPVTNDAEETKTFRILLDK